MTTETPTTTDQADATASDSGQNLSTADLVSAGQQDSDQVTSNGNEDSTPLFATDEASGFRDRWTKIQAAFVDDPRDAVQQADGLVAEAIQRLAAIFAEERKGLEDQWSAGQDVSTEDLRVALQRYRSFFDQLLSV
jgi:hypothetical protein